MAACPAVAATSWVWTRSQLSVPHGQDPALIHHGSTSIKHSFSLKVRNDTQVHPSKEQFHSYWARVDVLIRWANWAYLPLETSLVSSSVHGAPLDVGTFSWSKWRVHTKWDICSRLDPNWALTMFIWGSSTRRAERLSLWPTPRLGLNNPGSPLPLLLGPHDDIYGEIKQLNPRKLQFEISTVDRKRRSKITIVSKS